MSRAVYNATIVSEPTKFIWIRVPKTGTRSVFSLLRAADLEFEVENGFELQIADAKYRGYFKFTFVRNPYDRVISAWRDKIRGVGQGAGISSDLKQRLYDFDAFTEWLCCQRPAEMNIHFRPQSLLVPLDPDFIGRTESFRGDCEILWPMLGLVLPNRFPHANRSRDARLSIDGVSDSSRRRLNDLYAEDFRRFGYTVLE